MTWQRTSHNPEVAGSNPAPATGKALETGPFCCGLGTGGESFAQLLAGPSASKQESPRNESFVRRRREGPFAAEQLPAGPVARLISRGRVRCACGRRQLTAQRKRIALGAAGISSVAISSHASAKLGSAFGRVFAVGVPSCQGGSA